MSFTANPGRVAGFFYLLLVVLAPFRLIYIPGKLFVSGNAAATANNIATHELMFRLRLHHQVIVGAEVLWGLWLFPLGILTCRSRFLPRFLGVWLLINGVAYLAMSFSGLLLPQYENTVSDLAFPALLGEMVFMLWLVIRGARTRVLDAVASSAAG